MKTGSALCVATCLTLYSVTGSASPFPQQDEGYHPQDWTIGQAVKTTSGTIIGHAAKTAKNVSEYLGIPYAKPPLGDLRFAAPQRYRSDGNFSAGFYSPDCPSNSLDVASLVANLTPEQIIALLSSLTPAALNLLGAYGQLGNTMSEDCLTLNVWTKPQTGERSKAVLVWIYGGGFESGATNNPFYKGEYFANDQDVVLVSFNYRTNVFGFPGLPGLKDIPQNPGLLDQRMAIEWVRDNIAAFGGDPRRITIFGQSAGGASVDLYSYAYQNDPIAHAFIAQSGTAQAFFDPAPANNSVSWFNASVALGCGDSSVGEAASLACVRTKNTTDILKVIQVSDPLQSVLGNFGPTADGKVVFSDYNDRGSNGDFIQKPLLIGNNDYEAGLFRVLALAANRNYTDAAWCLFNADIFTCPVSKAASYRYQNGVTTYRYRYYGEFPNVRITNVPNSGTWHGAELPILFKTAEDSSGFNNTPAENAIQDYMQTAWAAFAKDPRGAFGNDPYNFPEYAPHGNNLIKFAVDNKTQPIFAQPETTDSLCPTLDFIDGLLPGGLIKQLTSTTLDLSALLALITQLAAEKGVQIPGMDKLIAALTSDGAPANGNRCPF